MLKKVHFWKNSFNLEIPNLIEFQTSSYKEFLEKGLKRLFEEFSPILDWTERNFELSFLDYFLEKPKTDPQEAKEKGLSFEAPLKVEVLLKIKPLNQVKKNEVYFCDLPLMTKRGTFILNGVERCIVSQLIRSPGIFFTSEFLYNVQYFGAKIIPYRGIWLEFETDRQGVIWVRIDRKKKVPASVLLRVFGIEDNETIKMIFEKEIKESQIDYIDRTLKKDHTRNLKEAYIEVYKCLRPGEIPTFDVAKEFLESRLFSLSKYDLSEVGRWRIEQRLKRFLPKKIEKESRLLKKEDIILTLKEIIRLNQDPKAKPDDIDHLGIRRVRTIGELLEASLRQALLRMTRLIKDRMSIIEISEAEPKVIVNTTPFANQIKEFFTLSQLSQFMDNQNPLAELEHKRRLTSIGPGGVARKRAGFEIRDVQPSHYGRLCPIQTPEGQNVGVITHLALFSRINPYGFLETPYFKVEKGKVKPEVKYLSAYEEEKYNIAICTASPKGNKDLLPKLVEGRAKGEPSLIPREKVDFMDVSPQQILSASASLIPFLENTDANRVLMGANMQRQAVTPLRPEVPIVATGMEEKIACNSGYLILAENSGRVSKVDSMRIEIETKKGKDVYNLPKFIRSNQYTMISFSPVVNLNQRVKKGEIIAEGSGIKEGQLSLGKNLLCAFIPWRGYNYEDAILISERVAREDLFTSAHIEDFTCDVRTTELGPEITTNDIPNVSEKKLANLDKDGIIIEGTEVKSGDILVGKVSPKGEEALSPEEVLLRKIFGERAKEVKDTSLILPHGKRGRVLKIRIFDRKKGWKGEPGVLKRVQVEIAYLRKIKVGDKLTGRHGNKGVIAKILPDEEMPFLEDGTPVDIVLNPISVASRMNLGQILEAHLGLAAKKLNYQAITPPFDGAKEEDIKRELEKAGFEKTGKVRLFDGRTGLPFKEKITVGWIYVMKLIHMVEDKIHMRSIGPYSLITQQPLGGKSQFGGQRLGEMEVWALEGYGAAYTLQEMLTIKSDDVLGRASAYKAILKGEKIEPPNIPSSFNVLVSELKALGFDIQLIKQGNSKNQKKSHGKTKRF